MGHFQLRYSAWGGYGPRSLASEYVRHLARACAACGMTSPVRRAVPGTAFAIAERLLVRCSGPEDAAVRTGALSRWPPLTRHQPIVQIRARRSQGRAIIVLWMRRTTRTWPGSCCTASDRAQGPRVPRARHPHLRRGQRGTRTSANCARKACIANRLALGCRAARRSPPARRLGTTPACSDARRARGLGRFFAEVRAAQTWHGSVTSCPSGQRRDRGRRQGRWSRPCDGVIVRPAGRRPGR